MKATQKLHELGQSIWLDNIRRDLRKLSMNILVIDVGGTHVKILATGQREPRKFDSGPKIERKADGARRQGACHGLEL